MTQRETNPAIALLWLIPWPPAAVWIATLTPRSFYAGLFTWTICRSSIIAIKTCRNRNSTQWMRAAFQTAGMVITIMMAEAVGCTAALFVLVAYAIGGSSPGGS